MKKKLTKSQQILLLRGQLKKVLDWPLPEGNYVKNYAIPEWLHRDCTETLRACQGHKNQNDK